LAKVAEQTGAAVVVVRHLTKQATGQAIMAGGGSIGIIGAARSGLLIARDPDDEDRRVLAVVKSNLAKRSESLSFRLEDAGSGWARVRWEGTSAHSADALIAATSDLHEKSALAEAKEMLADSLRDGPVAAKEVQRMARESGVSERTLRRAKEEMGVKPIKVGGSNGAWLWQLPAESGSGSPISGHLGHQSQNGGVSDSPSMDLKDGQQPVATFTSEAPGHLSRAASVRCTDPVCGGTLWRRKSGMVRCRVCVPETPWDPYVSPVLEGQAA
jgi:hypothetical protein